MRQARYTSKQARDHIDMVIIEESKILAKNIKHK